MASTTSAGSLAASKLFSLKGKVAVVTGGGTGIGLMIARGLADNGAKVRQLLLPFPAKTRPQGLHARPTLGAAERMSSRRLQKNISYPRQGGN